MFTLNHIRQQSRTFAGTNSDICTQLDPDAPNRQKRKLVVEDEALLA